MTRPWHKAFNLDFSLNEDNALTCTNKAMNPNSLMHHLKSKKDYWHQDTYLYLTSLYKDWWKDQTMLDNMDFTHHGILNMKSKNYEFQFKLYKGFGTQAPCMYNMDYDHPLKIK